MFSRPIGYNIDHETSRVIALLPQLLASARADDKPDLQTILDAWKAREQNTQSFDVRWWSKRVEDGLSNPAAAQEAMNNGLPVTAVPEITNIIQYRFIMDDKDRTRFEEKGKERSPPKAEYVPMTHIDISDGKKSNLEYLGGPVAFPTAFLSAEKFSFGQYLWTKPLALIYRPLNTIKDFTVSSDEIANKDHDPLLILKHEQDHEQQRVWVDPAKEFLPVRYVGKWEGTDSVRMDISYSKDDISGWVPDSWNIEMMNPYGKVQTSESAKVTRLSINKPIADSDFKLDLSGGVYVHDYSAQQHYVLRADGQRRPPPSDQNDPHAFEESIRDAPDSK